MGTGHFGLPFKANNRLRCGVRITVSSDLSGVIHRHLPKRYMRRTEIDDESEFFTGDLDVRGNGCGNFF